MQGDVILVRGVLHRVVREEMVTVCRYETPEQEKARKKAGKPQPEIRYMAVKTRPIVEQGKDEKKRRGI